MERESDKLKFCQTRKIGLGVFLAIFVFVGVTATYANSFSHSFPETHAIRREVTHIMTASSREIDNQRPIIKDCFLTGRKVQFQIVFERGFYYFIFINERRSLAQRNQFPMVSAGTYIIRRDAVSGVFCQIKIFLNNDSNTFLRINPHNEGTMLEFTLFNSVIYRNVLMPISINRLMTEPFETIMRLSDYIVNWDILRGFYNETENRFVMNVARAIDAKLHTLNDSDDGAQEWNRDFVFIETGSPNPAMGFNCSGFAKWVADGVFSARANRLMDISELKRKHLFDRRDTLSLVFEDERDPLFGLDWTRNIAMTIFELSAGRKARVSDVDVRNFPYERYSEDIGYSVTNLKAILYYLTVTNPGYIYLGSVNGDFGRNPVLRQHYHVVVFAPYICEEGNFHPLVYERNVRRPINEFIRRYNREFIHLVRIKVDDAFTLSEIPPFAE
ncbi:MAG: hypothetical protein FWD87_01390 [Spirochaetaceae bacterium]|nr:hypothetical protein [Spirochaetaceae bacterium]